MTSKKTEKRFHLIFFSCLLAVFLLRIYFSQYLTLHSDLNTFVGWGKKLSKVGFADFYATYWCDYMPGYLYILWLLNKIQSVFTTIPKEILFKLPANIADLILALIIFYNLKKFFPFKKAVFFSTLFFLNPAILGNSTFWGQIDSLHALPIVVSALFALKGKSFLSGMFFAIAFFIKPQSLVVLPLMLLANLLPYLDQKFVFKTTLKNFSKFIVSIIIVSASILFPFIYKSLNSIGDIFIQPLIFTFERFFGSYDQYKYASLNAFNFWGIFANWKSDQTILFGLKLKTWGTLVFSVLYSIVFLFYIKIRRGIKVSDHKKNYSLLFLVLSTIFLITFLFLTRVHERHLMTCIVMFSFMAALSQKYLFKYFVVSTVYTLNLVYAYVRITTSNKGFSEEIFTPIIFFLSSILILILICLVIDLIRKGFKEKLPENKNLFFKRILNKSKINKYGTFIFLALLFVLSFSIRAYNIDKPARYHFDENFFAFTASEMAKGNPLAWENKERAPGNEEYEWTHPPLGKEITAVGIKLFGNKPFSWRIAPVFFGALGSIFIFFLAKNLFKSNTAGVFVSILFTFESLIFVLSRISMVDIYLINFMILASLFFVKYWRSDKDKFLMLSAFFCGASMSVKWNGAFFAFFIFCATLVLDFFRKRKENMFFFSNLLKILLIFTIIPFAVYLASYIPFFVYGNSISDFFTLQIDMFEYHKAVDKLHRYRSMWWSWPLMLKPVCMYFQKLGKYREYIYALGNPAIFWSGILFFISALFYSIKNRYIPLVFAVAGFFACWLPWAVSPRKITYIYHFLPPLIFLLLTISFFLDKLWRRSLGYKMIVIFYFVCVVVTFIYFYPILTGETILRSEMNSYLWIKGWL